MPIPSHAEPTLHPAAFNFNARVLTPPSLDNAPIAAPLYRLDLPLIAMQAFRHDDLSDIRLFDAQGRAVPLRLVTAKQPANSQTYPLDVQALGAHQWLLVAPENTATPQQLSLQWVTHHLSTQAIVESSPNGQDWQLISTGQVSQNPNTGSLQPTVPVGGPPARLFRLTLNQPVQLIGASLQALDTAKPIVHSQPVEFVRHNQQYVLELEHPMSALGFAWPPLDDHPSQWTLQGLDTMNQVIWSSPLSQLPVAVEGHTLTHKTSQAAVNFAEPIRAQRWILSGPTSEPTLRANLSWPQQQLVFAGQGQPPYTLAIGYKDTLPAGPPLLDAPRNERAVESAQLGLIEHTQTARDWSFYVVWLLVVITVIAVIRIASRWLTRRRMTAFHEQLNRD